MKRTRSATSPSQLRKSSRLASKTPLKLKLFDEQHAFSKPPKDPFNFGYTADLCGKYNRFLPFAQEHITASSQFAPYRPGKEFQSVLNEINMILEDAFQRVESRMDYLGDQLDAFTEATISLNRWYEGGDLLSLDLEEMDDVLGRIDVREDVQRFIDYVRRIIPNAFQQEPTAEEYASESGTAVYRPVILVKSFKLIQLIIDQGRHEDAFHILVLLKSVIRRANSRVYPLDCGYVHQTFDRVTRAFISERSAMKGVKVSDLIHKPWNNTPWIRVAIDGITWHQFWKDTRHLRYWDFAAAARTLRAAYVAATCMEKSEHEYPNHCTMTCFHSSSLDLLDRLQTKAWSEIRANVFQTIGTLLPTELTERVFEFALLSEDIPLHPMVDANVLTDPPESIVQTAKARKLEPPPPRYKRRTKEPYLCSVVERQPAHLLEFYLKPGDSWI